MLKKLMTATILIVVGEVLSLTRGYIAQIINNTSNIVATIILIISIILETIGIILLLVCIASYDKNPKKK